MDTKKDSLKHATKMMMGKTHRASGQPIQKSLSDTVMMEMIKKQPELMEQYQDHQMEERPYLPQQKEFVAYLREQTSIKELTERGMQLDKRVKFDNERIRELESEVWELQKLTETLEDS